MAPPALRGWSCKTFKRTPSFCGATPTRISPALAPRSLTRFRGMGRTCTSRPFRGLSTPRASFDQSKPVQAQRLSPSGWRSGGAPLRHAAFVDFPSIHNRLPGRGDAKAHAVSPDGNDGDAKITVNDDLLTDSAREHQHSSPSVSKHGKRT